MVHVLLLNGHQVTWSLTNATRMSENDVKIKMADMNAAYFKDTYSCIFTDMLSFRKKNAGQRAMTLIVKHSAHV